MHLLTVVFQEEKLKDAKDQGADVTFQWGKDGSLYVFVECCVENMACAVLVLTIGN